MNGKNTFSIVKIIAALVLVLLPILGFGYQVTGIAQAAALPAQSSDSKPDNPFPGYRGTDGFVYAIAVSGTNVYIGGDFSHAGGVAANNIARWDGSQWHSMGSGIAGTVRAIAVHGTDVYIGGEFTYSGLLTVNNIARWNGISWNDVQLGVGGSSNVSVRALAFNSAGDLYVGGHFSVAGLNYAANIAMWDGSTWHGVGAGTGGSVNAIAVSGSKVYVGGTFPQAAGVPGTNGLALWNGIGWSSIGDVDGYVNTLHYSGLVLYVGGYFEHAGGVAARSIASYSPNVRGLKWAAVGWDLSYPTQVIVYAVTMYNGSVYVGGIFGAPPQQFFLSRWNGSYWSDPGGTDDQVYALATGSAGMYMGGRFDYVHNILVHHVALWDGTNWHPMGTY